MQFVKGLRTLYDAGARVFVEVGPKKALQGFAEDVLGDRGDVVSLFTNHPKVGDIAAFNQALCGLYAAGLGVATAADRQRGVGGCASQCRRLSHNYESRREAVSADCRRAAPQLRRHDCITYNGDRYVELGRMFADVLDRGWQIYHGQKRSERSDRWRSPERLWACREPSTSSMMATSAAFCAAINSSTPIPSALRRDMLDKHITRLVKSDNGEATFETINDVADVIKLAGRGGAFDLEKEFGVSAERLAALDRVTRLAIAVGIDALRDAGIPLVMRYKTTTKGTQLPDRWGLPDAMRDDTGVIFASAFPGYDSFADEMARYYADHARREQLAMLEDLRASVAETNGHSRPGAGDRPAHRRVARSDRQRARMSSTGASCFRVLSMGHSQFAEFIGARGPNTQINAACASTTQAVGLAEDWIRAGRCRRVIIISADDVTSDHLIDWFGAGFLASGAAATDEVVEEAAIPFDRRRHGMIMGMGAAALVVESAEAARERGIQPICEVLERGDGQQRFPWHSSRCAAHRPGDGEAWLPRRKRTAAFSAIRLRRRRSSFPTKPTRRRAAAAPRRRSTRCATSSATPPIRS